jgi:hypothetical protein
MIRASAGLDRQMTRNVIEGPCGGNGQLPGVTPLRLRLGVSGAVTVLENTPSHQCSVLLLAKFWQRRCSLALESALIMSGNGAAGYATWRANVNHGRVRRTDYVAKMKATEEMYTGCNTAADFAVIAPASALLHMFGDHGTAPLGRTRHLPHPATVGRLQTAYDGRRGAS